MEFINKTFKLSITQRGQEGMKKFWKNWALREVQGGVEPKNFLFDIIPWLIIAISVLGVAFLVWRNLK